MRRHTKTPFSNQRNFIPKDRRVDEGQIHPVSYYSVTSQDISLSTGSSSDLGNPDNPQSGDGSTGNLEDSLPLISSAVVTPSSIIDTEPTANTHLLEVL